MAARTGTSADTEFRVRARVRTYDVEGFGASHKHGITDCSGSEVSKTVHVLENSISTEKLAVVLWSRHSTVATSSSLPTL